MELYVHALIQDSQRDATAMIYKSTTVKFFCYVFCLVGALLTTACFSPDKSDLVNLRYPSAYDFARKTDDGNYEYNSYKVKKGYPSLDVYYFYKKIFDDLNFKEIDIECYGSTRWFSFVDGTIKDQPIIHQFKAIWVDSDEKYMCVLVIDYYSKSGKITDSAKPDNDVQHVSFQKTPYVKLN